MSHKYTNDLINETSPYLLQHAHNPVNWVSWNEKVLKEAKKKGKLIIVSIGYSACHWCHVMEHESFEDEEVADLMNAHFTNIKIDREERPDIDQIYMSAVQLMTNSGGWPLNCICLPDGRPIYGGTYFPKDQWINILKNLVHLYQEDEQKMLDYADKLEEGIQKFELIEKNDASDIQKDDIEEMVLRWSKNFDQREGGPNRAPKFPLPNNYEFLMNYAFLSGDENVKNHVALTLNKMALGGIYDQIGGGFSRYSVDVLWKVPHFEKMLYDNAQLIHLYSLAFQWTQNPLYKEIVYQTIDWLEREMRDDSGAFYSALDADSEGEEGKFYIWSKKEIKELLDPKDYEWITNYYAIDDRGKWEDNYILLRPQTDEVFAKKNSTTTEEVKNNRNRINTILFEAREKRVSPGLDDKSLTSWNAMTTKGLLTAYKVFKEKEFLMLAKANYCWWEENQWQNGGGLWRNYKNKQSNIQGFLDDYACSIEMLLSFYTINFDEKYLKAAKHICMFTIQHFWDEKRQMFFYTHVDQKDILTRKMEVSDNVIPASNSIMANNLYQLSLYFANPEWQKMSFQMLRNVSENMSSYGSGYSNWGILALKKVYRSHELVIMGHDFQKYLDDCHQIYLPHIILAGSDEETIPITEKRASAITQFYLCENGACQLPEKNWGKIVKELNLNAKK